MFCQNCGANFNSRFCPTCGLAASTAGQAPVAVPLQNPAAGGIDDNVAGALCYLAGIITGVIFLVVAPYNRKPGIRFHAFQSILLHVAWFALFVVEMIVSIAMPLSLSLLLHGLGLMVAMGGFGLWFYLMWRAYENRPLVLPVIGQIAKGQAEKQ